MQRPYAKQAFAATLATVLFAAAANFVVDPYGVYRAVDREGFNRIKPKAGPSGEMVKPYAVERIRPKTLLLGNSRVEAGIDPESPVWPEAYRPVFNMALPATGIDVALKSLLHVSAIKPIETVVLGVDFVDFLVGAHRPENPGPGPHGSSEFDRRLYVYGDASGNHPDLLQRLRDKAATLVSLNALFDSAVTLVLQRQPDQPDLTALGFNPMREYARFAKTEGYPPIFKQVETTYLGNYLRESKVLYSRAGDTSAELDQLRALIRFCREHNIRLLLYIHPYHAHMLEMYRLAGLWPLFEEWKRALVRIVEAEAAVSRGQPQLELWDFSGYSGITTESMPTMREKGRLMQWYWEVGHYKGEVGNLVLDRLLSAGGQEDQAPDGFGIRLTSGNVDARIEAIRNLREHYAGERSDEIATLEAIAGKIRGRPVHAIHGDDGPVPAAQSAVQRPDQR